MSNLPFQPPKHSHYNTTTNNQHNTTTTQAQLSERNSNTTQPLHTVNTTTTLQTLTPQMKPKHNHNRITTHNTTQPQHGHSTATTQSTTHHTHNFKCDSRQTQQHLRAKGDEISLFIARKTFLSVNKTIRTSNRSFSLFNNF